MRELIDTHPDIGVQESEFKRLLGYPARHVLEGRARELADATREWYAKHGKPWVYLRQVDGLELTNGQLRLGGGIFPSKQLHDLFSAGEAHTALVAAVSAGPECEEKARQFWHEGKPDEYFFMEMYGSAVVEHLIMGAGGRICGWAEQNEMTVLPHYSPGYSGWDVADQLGLWELIRPQNGRPLPGTLKVMDTGMLRPKKSLLAVFGVTRRLDLARKFSNLVPCENCSLPGCPYRRAPYKNFLPQIEDVRQFQPDVPEDETPIGNSMLNHQAKYTVNDRALRKWSDERLQLTVLPGGSVEARFRYDGTTCSNMGRPLQYDYRVVLGPSNTGHPILEVNCTPSPGDTGHIVMCEYLNDGEEFMRRVEGEKPLLGRPLNDVLSWERPYDPSGCYCTADSREHKWGLVLEVIHFALVQREKAAGINGQPGQALE